MKEKEWERAGRENWIKGIVIYANQINEEMQNSSQKNREKFRKTFTFKAALASELTNRRHRTQ